MDVTLNGFARQFDLGPGAWPGGWSAQAAEPGPRTVGTMLLLPADLERLTSLHGEDDLTDYLACFQGAVGFGGLVQGERRADLDA